MFPSIFLIDHSRTSLRVAYICQAIDLGFYFIIRVATLPCGEFELAAGEISPFAGDDGEPHRLHSLPLFLLVLQSQRTARQPRAGCPASSLPQPQTLPLISLAPPTIHAHPTAARTCLPPFLALSETKAEPLSTIPKSKQFLTTSP